MEVGKKYRGSVYVNEFGQLEFTPDQKHDDSDKKCKLVKKGNGFEILRTAKTVKINLTIPRSDNPKIRTQFIMKTQMILVELSKYDLK